MHTGLSKRRRRLVLENLEQRRVLTANSLGAISGNVAFDADGNGMVEAGEQIVGASLELFLDEDGDGFIDPQDDFVASGVTDNDGNFVFMGLTPGNYIVVQPMQTADGITLERRASPIVVIDQGFVDGLLIDDFSGMSSVETDVPDTTEVEGVFTATSALGGQRDLIASIMDSTDETDLTRLSTDIGQLLVSGDATSRLSVIWDGVDQVGDGINFTGLGGIDLAGDAIRLAGLGSPFSLATLQMRVYTNAAEYSEFTISDFGNVLLADLCVPFVGTNPDGVGFVAMGSTGGADFSNVGAIELVITTRETDAALSLDEVHVVGSELESVQFINEALPASIGLQVSIDGEVCDESEDCTPVPVTTGNNFPVVYTVTNLGGEALTSISLVSELEGSIGAENITSRSVNEDDILDIGETWVFTTTLSADEGLYRSDVELTALDSELTTVSASDSAEYFGVTATATLDLVINGVDGTEMSNPLEVETGAEITFTITVANTGNVRLQEDSITVSDDSQPVVPTLISQSIDDDAFIDIGEVWTYEYVTTAASGLEAVVAEIAASAADFTGFAAEVGSDTEFYESLAGSEMVLTVLTNGLNVNDPAAAEMVTAGEDVTFTYGVFNSGSNELTDIMVADDNGTPEDDSDDFSATFMSGDDDEDGILDPGEAWVYSATRTAVVGSFSNVATASAVDPSSDTIMSEDRGYYIGLEPDFSWHNADAPNDVNNDGVVNPIDANIIITELNLREFSDPVTSELDELTQATSVFYDVNNDGVVSPLDAVIVIAALPSTSALSAGAVTFDEDSRLGRDISHQSLNTASVSEEDSHQRASLAVDRIMAAFDPERDGQLER